MRRFTIKIIPARKQTYVEVHEGCLFHRKASQIFPGRMRADIYAVDLGKELERKGYKVDYEVV